MFDATIFSCLEGFVKPQPEIYAIALKKLKIKAEEAIFVDDKAENVQGAKSAGMHGIVFTNVARFQKELKLFLQ